MPKTIRSGANASATSKPEQEPLIQTIREFVEIESPSDNKPAADRMGAFLAERFEALGGRPRFHPADDFGDNLQIDFPSAEKT